jgi:hypothetical protein
MRPHATHHPTHAGAHTTCARGIRPGRDRRRPLTLRPITDRRIRALVQEVYLQILMNLQEVDQFVIQPARVKTSARAEHCLHLNGDVRADDTQDSGPAALGATPLSLDDRAKCSTGKCGRARGPCLGTLLSVSNIRCGRAAFDRGPGAWPRAAAPAGRHGAARPGPGRGALNTQTRRRASAGVNGGARQWSASKPGCRQGKRTRATPGKCNYDGP